MRYNGQSIKSISQDEIALPRHNAPPLRLLVTALMGNEERDAKVLFPDPECPYGFLKDERGAPLRDEDKKVISGPLFSDPAFLRAVERAEYLRFVFRFVKALRGDERIEWGCGKPQTAAHYEQCAAEIEEAGITEGDMHLVVRRALQLGNLDNDAIKRAAEAFSQPVQPQE